MQPLHTVQILCNIVTSAHMLTYRWYLGPSGVPLADVHLFAYAGFCSGKLNLHILFQHYTACLDFPLQHT